MLSSRSDVGNFSVEAVFSDQGCIKVTIKAKKDRLQSLLLPSHHSPFKGTVMHSLYLM